jgi:hypothetical protein
MRPWPMRELHILLKRRDASEHVLVPVCYFEDWKQWDALLKAYAAYERPSASTPGTVGGVWMEDLQRLSTITMVRRDQVRQTVRGCRSLLVYHSRSYKDSQHGPTLVALAQHKREDALVDAIVARVVKCLREQGKMPVAVPRPVAIGFEQQAKKLMAMLHGGRYLWLHGPGGRTALPWLQAGA